MRDIVEPDSKELSQESEAIYNTIEEMDTQEADSTEAVLADSEDMEEVDNHLLTPPVNGSLSHNHQQQSELPDDEARSEACFSFRVENFSKLHESVLSPPCIVRNLPWKIMAMPRYASQDRKSQRSLGFFLQCNGNSDSVSWSCQASAELRLLSIKPGVEDCVRKISHLFYVKENDWGFSSFIPWNEVLDEQRGFIKDDAITLQVKVNADAPHGVCWDSKKHTGYVGLKNQGATCYMNSLLQVLFFTNELRKAVYKMPTENDESAKSVALALQRVFYELQFSDRPVGTKKLTKSFGWETMDSFMQHDVQEFLRVLLDKLENKMKATCVEGSIPRLFEGKTISYCRCKHIDYTSRLTETYYDIQLNIKGKKNIYESFEDYIEPQTLDGENKYAAGEHGLQEAEKGVIFETLPPVLYLHLMRFQYDPLADTSVKFNDRFEFPEILDLTRFLQSSDEREQTEYVLHAVLVHSGDNHGGHYVVFINPCADGKWCKFDDDVVSRCTKQEAIEHNFGGQDEDGGLAVRHCTSAYMLVYISRQHIPHILEDVSEHDIPVELVERLQEEKRLETLRRKERSEQCHYMSVQVVLEDSFEGHQGHDLFNPENVHYYTFRIRKASTLQTMMEVFSEAFKVGVERMRPWPITTRTNQTCRPTILDVSADLDKKLTELSDTPSAWMLFLEIAWPDTFSASPTLPPARSNATTTSVPTPILPSYDKDHDVVLFFRQYVPSERCMVYCGHAYVPLSASVSTLVPLLRRRARLPASVPLLLYEELKPNTVQPLLATDTTLDKCMDEVMDGDIIIFQRADEAERQDLQLPTVDAYFRDMFHRIEVTFCDKCVPGDTGFTLSLSQLMTYDQMAKQVALRLGTDPHMLQFFKAQNYREGPGTALRCGFEGQLRDLLVGCKPRMPKRFYYQQLTIPVNELENKKQIKCVYVDSQLREEKELVLYPDKAGTVADLLQEAVRQLQTSCSPPAAPPSLRLLEVVSHRIISVFKSCMRLDNLPAGCNRTFRVEEVPPDEVALPESQMLVPCAHFQKEHYSTYGTPFLVKITENELFSEVKERIRQRLEQTDKEMDKIRFAIVSQSSVRFLPDDVDSRLKLHDFRSKPVPGMSSIPLAWLGMDHVNKSTKRARYNYLEKAIKIYN